MKKSIMNLKNLQQQDLCCVVLIVVLLGLAVYFFLKENRMAGLEGFENASLNKVTEKPNPGDNECVVMLFYVDWCPHCVSTKPEWNKLQKLDGTTINNTKVNVSSCNCEEGNLEKELASENNVEGYPTIKIINNKEILDYNGPRDAQSIENFLKENLN
jgi:thiol-disulfide isomerase/thioredoxin